MRLTKYDPEDKDSHLNVTYVGVVFSGMDLSNVWFESCVFKKCVFKDCVISEETFRWCSFHRGCTLRGTNKTGVLKDKKVNPLPPPLSNGTNSFFGSDLHVPLSLLFTMPGHVYQRVYVCLEIDKVSTPYWRLKLLNQAGEIRFKQRNL